MNDVFWAMLSYSVAAVGVVLIFVFWFEAGRRRNRALQFMLVGTAVFGVLGIVITYHLAAQEGVSVGWLMLPAFVTIGLSIIVLVLIQLSPPMDPVHPAPPIPIDQLSEKTMREVMRGRNEAIDTLARRRMLADVDVKALKARPLGRLQIEEDA